ncbi:MAG: hypothetical protein CSA81_04225 [Acidobacteria bacterium]|nr:MAG: hypothetical protein CSA81_04225 [Acidobacteriota bacterium]PIE89525.1 MAG: hypothetical protein CR997_10525 [Acidobacteriota bacterium]
MVAIKPFKGFTPRPEMAEQVASPPYDVLSSEEAQQMASGNPNSFLRVVKSEIDFKDGAKPSKEQIFQRALENLNRLIDENILVQDDEPCFYLYQQKMGEHVQVGLVCGSSVDDYNAGKIKKHEFTRTDKENERTRHIEVINANTGPVFLTYGHRDDMDRFVEQILTRQPYIDLVAKDGIAHTLWKVHSKDEIAKIEGIFSELDATYVADGHHRAAAASRVQAIKQKENPNHTGDEAYNYFLTVVFPDNQMYIMDYNRVLKDLNGLTEQELMTKLKEKFEVSELSVSDPQDAKPQSRNHFSMYLDKKWYRLIIKEHLIPKDDPVNSLDAALLQNEVLSPLFNIQDPRTATNIDFVGGIRGLKELVKRCENGYKVAFALYPTGIDQLMNVADSGNVMPPKSTWFEPKLRSGMVVRMLSE